MVVQPEQGSLTSTSTPTSIEDPGRRRPVVDLVDDSFLACAPELVAEVVAESARWTRWWPDLRMTTTRDRGAKGLQWAVEGAVVGTAEIWLEPYWDGVLLHFYLRADPRRGDADSRWARRELARRAQRWKRQVHALKDELEGGRAPGGPSAGAGGADDE